MHTINVSNSSLRTDLIIEKECDSKQEIENYGEDIVITKSKIDGNSYTTISFQDITDKDNFQDVLDVFVKELKSFLNISSKDTILVIGLGNDKSTPDCLGPYTVDNVLVTRYLFLLGDVEEGYSNVCSFIPNVTGNTGIETACIIKSIIKDAEATKVIVVDSLKTSSIDRLTKTIQITNQGISPGSGVQNNRQEISKKTMGIDIIAIGVPTVVDIRSILDSFFDEKYELKENLIVTPTSIDFTIEKLGLLIGDGINICLHKNFIRQNNY